MRRSCLSSRPRLGFGFGLGVRLVGEFPVGGGGAAGEELVIVREGMLSHFELGDRGLLYPIELPLQAVEGEGPLLQLGFEIVGYRRFLVQGGCQVQGFDHEPGRPVGFVGALQQLPQLTPAVVGEQILLPSAVEEGPRLAPQAVNDVAVVDAARPPLLDPRRDPNAGQLYHWVSSQVAHQAVVVQMHGQPMANQA